MDRAADEIIAYFNEVDTNSNNRFPDKEYQEYVRKLLVEDPLYDYFRKWKNDWRNVMTVVGIDKKDLEELYKLNNQGYKKLHQATRKVVKYYVEKYKQLVTKAVKTYYKLTETLGDPQLVQGLLIKIPLDQWPKIVRRIEFNLSS